MDNSPIFKKHYQRWIETLRVAWQNEQLRALEQVRRAQTERHIILIVLVLAIGIAAATALLLSGAEPGSYCAYPDPYGR